MRTERFFIFGTHFFCVLERVCFLHTWALGKMLCYPLFPLYLCIIKKIITACQKPIQVRRATVIYSEKRNFNIE